MPILKSFQARNPPYFVETCHQRDGHESEVCASCVKVVVAFISTTRIETHTRPTILLHVSKTFVGIPLSADGLLPFAFCICLPPPRLPSTSCHPKMTRYCNLSSIASLPLGMQQSLILGVRRAQQMIITLTMLFESSLLTLYAT